MSRPLFCRSALFSLVLGCSRPLVGVDAESSEVAQETPHPLRFFLAPHTARVPHHFSEHHALRCVVLTRKPVFLRLLIPSVVSSVVSPCGVSCRRVDSRCGQHRYHNNILVLYSPVTCVHIEPASPTPSTAPPLPCETHSAQSLSITLLVEN